MNAVEITALTHRYPRGEEALRSIDLAVPTGSVYGFLGPNGAGKTTALRLLLGLLRPQSGAIRVLGRSIADDRLAILRRVGSSIESPSIYPHLTAAENLEVWRLGFDCPGKRIADALRLVDLSDTGRKLAGEFSLGMKQRLAIATALLHEPDLLVLDEPTNGLDPHGMSEMRELLTRLNRDRGVTVLVSSHILSEIERLATHVGIINRGALLFEGPLADLENRRRAMSVVLINTNDNARAAAVLNHAGWRLETDETGLRVAASPEEAARVNRLLVEAGLAVHEITRRRTSLEDIFMNLVES